MHGPKRWTSRALLLLAGLACINPPLPAQDAVSLTVFTRPNPSRPWQNVFFGAAVNAADLTGAHVAFSADGVSIAGCEAVPFTRNRYPNFACVASIPALGRHEVVATLSDVSRGLMVRSNAVEHLVVAAPPIPGQRDFDGDGKGDLVLESGGGESRICAHLASHTADCDPVFLWGLYDYLQWPYQVTHVAYLWGRHYFPGLLMRDAVTGDTLIADVASGAGPSIVSAHPSWRATHTGDFNGDGVAEILWHQAATGTTSLAFNQHMLGSTLLVHADWRVTHVADFDGDGKSDLLWRNTATGETAIWLMDGTRFVRGSIVLSLRAWRAILTADFDGDGRADLVWHNEATGETALWIMNGDRMTAGAIVVSNRDWIPTHVADLDGYGRSDLLWRHTPTGRVNAWLMNGLAMLAGGTITYPGSSVVTSLDFDGDGREDLVWRDRTTGVHVLQLMDGLAPVGVPIPISSDPLATVLP